MAQKSPTTLPVRKFFGKYASAIEKARAAEERQWSGTTFREILKNAEYEPFRLISTADLWGEVGQWWPIRLLRQAAEEGDREGCKRLLDYILLHLGVQLPPGVLISFRWKRGRPNETEGIYEAWIAKGQPAVTWRVCDDLAKTFYPNEFAQAKCNPNLRKKLRDRVRGTILRHLLALGATKSVAIS